ncbi:MAG TPA: hypothetical protein GX707_18060, partial [Epulopiscium sp.]|nr:hypothetical protein [Candidatus Epulonipiscium sp.]
MKKMISLIISASIFLQMVVPAASMVTYAQTGGNPSNFKWMDNGRLDDKLDLQSAREQSTEALVSWGIKDDIKKYELEYFIENQKDTEKVRFTFEKVEGKESDAKVTLQVLDTEEEEKSKEKDYYEYDFSGINPDGVIKHIGKESIEINITEGTRFPGGRVSVGNMEIKFRWKDGKIHFHTNYIKHGNITPFTLIYGGNTEDTEVIKVLTGIDGYNVSPVHIETQTTGSSIIINNKQTIKVPEGKEEPGSKPGVKVEFKRPKQWVGTGFTELQDGDEKNIHATLVLEDLTGVATAQLNFDLSEESDISGLGDTKQLLYDKDKGVYSLYLAKDDLVKDGQPHENIVKWEKLDKSMILKTIRLTLIQGKTEEEKAQALGSFTPNVESGGRHTYLGYTIHRSSMEEAFIRIKPYSGARNTEYKYFVQYADSMKDGETKWVNLVEHTYRATGDKAGENEFTIPVPFSSDFSTQYYRVIATYNEVEMSSQILHYEPDKDQTVPPPTPVIRSIDNIYAVPPEKLGDQPETIGFDLT